MSRKALFLWLGLMMILSGALYSAPIENPLEANSADVYGELRYDATRAPCTAYKCNLSPSIISYFSGFANGMINVTYFDPTDPVLAGCGESDPYPFQITALSFTLFTDFESPPIAEWPVTVDVVVFDYDPAGGPCMGPGAELCRVTATCQQADFEDPNFGTVFFPEPCCVEGPFFIGLEYNNTGLTPYPSITYDDNEAPIECDNWFRYQGTWYEWYDIWQQPGPGYPYFIVDGETDAGPCKSWQPGDDHKMHFPQLPDEDGWDVWATNPVVLADDWTCSETGPVKDVHFWGSWYGDYVDEIEFFVLSIHEDIPADPPSLPYSRPGITLWEYDVSDFVVTPIDPPTMEGWYDPTTDEAFWDDHASYFQYDVYLPEQMWFDQVEGTIYWLNI